LIHGTFLEPLTKVQRTFDRVFFLVPPLGEAAKQWPAQIIRDHLVIHS
jgi:hypothetical protein